MSSPTILLDLSPEKPQRARLTQSVTGNRNKKKFFPHMDSRICLNYHEFMSLLIHIFFSLLTVIHAEITPPNYDFTLKTIENFTPGKEIESVKKDNPKYDVFSDEGSSKILRFKIKRTNYVLDIYTQVKKDIITDVFVRLPQFFLHDIFLADLQKKYQKQDRYVRKDRSAIYVWLNRDNTNIIYHGSCSITCFPMFIEIVSTDKSVIPMYVKLNEALPKW